MTNTNTNKAYKIVSTITLHLLIPILLGVLIAYLIWYVLGGITLGMEFGVVAYVIIYIPVALVSFLVGVIFVKATKGKQAENDVDRKSISRKKTYVIYLLTIIYHIFIIQYLDKRVDYLFLIQIIPIVLYSSILTKMFIINIKDKHKDRGLKAFINAHLIYVECAWLAITLLYS